MKKIDLFCSAGMSTSMLANKMQEVADAHGIQVKVEAFSSTAIDFQVEHNTPDCILLGPQVRFSFDDVNAKYGAWFYCIGFLAIRFICDFIKMERC